MRFLQGGEHCRLILVSGLLSILPAPPLPPSRCCCRRACKATSTSRGSLLEGAGSGGREDLGQPQRAQPQSPPGPACPSDRSLDRFPSPACPLEPPSSARKSQARGEGATGAGNPSPLPPSGLETIRIFILFLAFGFDFPFLTKSPVKNRKASLDV